MEVLEGLMSALAEKLRSLLGREYALQSGVRGDIDFLQSELQRIHAFLQDHAKRHSTTALVKDRAREVQELAYDVEDAVDEFTHRVGPAPPGIPAKVVYLVSTLMARRQIAEQASDLRARALEVSKRHRRYDEPLPPPEAAPSHAPQLAPEVYAQITNPSSLVGVDGARDEIIAKLVDAGTNDASGRRRVASIVGFAGIGKTTLAMAVYRGLEDRFPSRAFVTVSRPFDIKRVLRDILQQQVIVNGSSSMVDPDLVMAGAETWEEESQLVGNVRENLQGKRYLIIIDDLWETSAWEDISSVLPDNNRNSIIITTTRNESVADVCCSSYHLGNFVYRVAFMNDSDSKALFFGRIFGSEDNCPHDLKEVSMKILKKCGGLPLAIVCISSLLAATRPQARATRWEKVYSSLGSEIGRSGSLYRLKQALQLAFDDLPQHLKVCVLYLSSFPEHCKIEKDRLMRRWIAEGFVAEKPDMSVQEVAESYFSELIERSMVQAVDVDYRGEARACRIHDVMFELVAMKSFEENFVTLVGDRWGSSTQQCNVRRLSLNCRNATDGFDFSSFDMSHVRSLTIYGDIGSINSISECRFLRMLDFECCEGVDNRHLKNIGDLFLLKYLSLKSTWISELPMQIGDLKCLETLDLTQTNIKELPNEVTRLQRLVHLLAGGAELPRGVGNMMSLQTLSIRAVSRRSREAMEELLRLINLRKLDMSYVHPKLERLDTRLPLVISKLGNCKLQSLHLSLLGYSTGLFLKLQSSLYAPPDTLQSLKIKGEYGFVRVPMWISSLTYLVDLELTVAAMDEGDLEILAELPRLIRFRLTLQEPSTQGISIAIQESGFPSLKELYINCRIMPVFFSQDVMLKLQKFELQFHAYPQDLNFVQFGTEHFQSLKEFRFTVVCKDIGDPGIEFLKEAFKNAVFI